MDGENKESAMEVEEGGDAAGCAAKDPPQQSSAAMEEEDSPPPPPATTRGGVAAGPGKGRRGGGGSSSRSISPMVPPSSSSNAAVVDAVTQASLGQASALLGGWGYHGLAGLLAAQLQAPGGGGPGGGGAKAAAGQGSGPAAAAASLNAAAGAAEGEQGGAAGSAAAAPAAAPVAPAAGPASSAAASDIIPSRAAVHAAATKSVADNPPWVHWSKTDMAPQLKAPFEGSYRTLLSQQQLRGYRMARASHGVSRGCHYFECVLLDGPAARDILSQLPSNARLGPGLQEMLSRRAAWEQEQEKARQKGSEDKEDDEEESSAPGASPPPPEEAAPKPGRKRKHDEAGGGGGAAASATASSPALPSPPPPRVGGHVRLGWSMRTGDLQAPVGYDKWSYAIRDIGGSLVHKSERQDHWGGLALEPGDVVGCAVALYDGAGKDANDDAKSRNHVRFFKNGECMGHFVVSKGKREGGEAFTGLDAGTYYPAVSSYMGGSVQVNFGPHWLYPPRKLPQGLKFQPMCDLCPPPLKPDEAVKKCAPALKLFWKVEHQNALREAILEEASVLCDAYDRYWQWHLAQLRKCRSDRGLSVHDLPTPRAEQQDDGEAAAAKP